MKLLLPLFTDALGDNVLHNYIATNLAASLNAEITVLLHEDRPYKSEIVRFFNPSTNHILPVDPLAVPFFPHLYRNFFILTYEYLQWSVAAQFQNPIFLRPVWEREGNEKNFHVCAQFLSNLGLQSGNWHCIIHSRELGYQYKLGHANLRCADPMNYFKVAEYVVDKLGGQVIRLGDPSMTKWPKKEGIIDLTVLSGLGVFVCQALALSNARFVIATDGGIHPVGSAFGVPTLLSNLTTSAFCWNPWDLLLTKHFRMTDGRKLSNEDALMGNLLKYQDTRDIPADSGIQQVEENSVEELIAAVHQLHLNAECLPEWRNRQAHLQRSHTAFWANQKIACIGAQFFRPN
jgi:putative glycosyltransferase (TIGR04372 family)